jgi:orotate phosphoribosyltransferase
VSFITKNRLAAEIYALCRISGRFLLRSGRQTHTYFDKYRFEAPPAILAAVAKEMVPSFPRGQKFLRGWNWGAFPS